MLHSKMSSCLCRNSHGMEYEKSHSQINRYTYIPGTSSGLSKHNTCRHTDTHTQQNMKTRNTDSPKIGLTQRSTKANLFEISHTQTKTSTQSHTIKQTTTTKAGLSRKQNFSPQVCPRWSSLSIGPPSPVDLCGRLSLYIGPPSVVHASSVSVCLCQGLVGH